MACADSDIGFAARVMAAALGGDNGESEAGAGVIDGPRSDWLAALLGDG